MTPDCRRPEKGQEYQVVRIIEKDSDSQFSRVFAGTAKS
jgi:hypothetical protein